MRKQRGNSRTQNHGMSNPEVDLFTQRVQGDADEATWTSVRVASVEGKGGSAPSNDRTAVGHERPRGHERAHLTLRFPKKLRGAHRQGCSGTMDFARAGSNTQCGGLSQRTWAVRFPAKIVATDTSRETPTYLASVESEVSGRPR